MFNTRLSIMRSLGFSTLKQSRHLYPSNNSGAVVTKVHGGRPFVAIFYTPGQGFGSLITRAKAAIIETWVLRVAGWLSFILC